MDSLSVSLENFLRKKGAALCGFADLSGIPGAELPYGVCVAVRLPAPVLHSIADGPTRLYFDAYHALNDQLDGLVTAGAEYLTGRGFEAFAQTRDNVEEGPDYRTRLPHKTVATLSGLGWIGKSALFVSFRYGPAVRLSSLLTDAPLTCGDPVTHSRCGACQECQKACPGKAISGRLWKPGLDRDEFFNANACHDAARALAAQRIGEEITLCGKCIEVCPYTARSLECPEEP